MHVQLRSLKIYFQIKYFILFRKHESKKENKTKKNQNVYLKRFWSMMI